MKSPRRVTLTSKERAIKKQSDQLEQDVTDLAQAKNRRDVRDHIQITKDLDVGTISAGTVDRLIAFLGIDGDNPIEETLNKQRIEHQKTVPMTKK
jgi:hypothetical protein